MLLRKASKIGKVVSIVGFGVACAIVGAVLIRYGNKKKEYKEKMSNEPDAINMTDEEIEDEAAKMAFKSIKDDTTALANIVKPVILSGTGYIVHKSADYIYELVHRQCAIFYKDEVEKIVRKTIKKFIGEGYTRTFETNKGNRGVLVYATNRAINKIMLELKNQI